MSKLTVVSKDGTTIAFERAGTGPVVILVGGGLTDRSELEPLVPALAEDFTVVNYDRRGRGASGDSSHYAVACEVEAWKSYTRELDLSLAAGDRGAALAAFLRVTGTPEDAIAGMRQAPFWSDLEAMAHTLGCDAACLGTGQPPVDRLATIRQPVLTLTGDQRPPDAAKWVLALDTAADTIAAAIPNAERETLTNQGHVADPDTVAKRLAGYFAA